MKRKLLTFVVAIMAVISIGSLSASAASVTLKTTQTSAVSGNVTGTWKYFNGKNNSTSLHSVYFTAQYSDGDGWHDDAQSLVPKGVTLGDTNTSTRQNCLWRLELNPQGYGYTNCSANGQILL